MSLVTDPYNLFDNDYGIYVYGDEYNPAYPHFGANFWEDWERPIHFSLYNEDGTLAANYNAGVKIFGGWSRGQDQRSLSIFARGGYGVSEFQYQFFEDINYDEFQSLVLRNSGNDWLRSNIRDIATTSLMEGTDLDYQRYTSVASYINGDYWGIYHMREKTSENMLASKHNIDADEIDLLELNAEIVDGNVISIQNIPDGTIVCNVEQQFGDGGALMKSAGADATVFSHSDDGVVLKLASGKFKKLNPKNRAMIGTLAGGGVGDRPLMRAGVKMMRFKSKGKKYPIVRGVAQAAYVHPHGGGRHQHVGQSSTVSRDTPPGAKVGSIAARKTGRARIKERKQSIK